MLGAEMQIRSAGFIGEPKESDDVGFLQCGSDGGTALIIEVGKFDADEVVSGELVELCANDDGTDLTCVAVTGHIVEAQLQRRRNVQAFFGGKEESGNADVVGEPFPWCIGARRVSKPERKFQRNTA